jgi:hypothetical protein
MEFTFWQMFVIANLTQVNLILQAAISWKVTATIVA